MPCAAYHILPTTYKCCMNRHDIAKLFNTFLYDFKFFLPRYFLSAILFKSYFLSKAGKTDLYRRFQIGFTVLVNLGISFLNFSGSSLAPAFQYSYSIHASSGICASIASIHWPSAGARGTTPVSSTY